MKNVKGIKMIVLLLFGGVFVASAIHTLAAENKEGTIYAGVYLDNVYVGGLSKEEAMEEYEQYIDGIEDLTITISATAGSYTTTLGEIGVSVSLEDAVNQAYNYGRKGNILSRYKEIKSLEEENVVLVPTKEFDADVLKEKLETETADMVTEPKNASITRENGEFIIQDGVVGETIDVDKTIEQVEEVFAEEWEQKDVKVAAVVDKKEPTYTKEDFEMIDSVLGSSSTDYSQGNTARCQNLATGASKISGTVLMPGEQFSVYNTVAPFNEENGYANAGMYVSDAEGNIETIDGYGGGICQVSTTLYLSVLRAELQVDERYPHSLTVSYVKHGMDAAIAGDYMDFKFTNDTGYPLYIEGYAGGGSISFAIYGHETRPSNRTIAFESVDVKTYEPGEPEEEEDDTLEEGKTVTEQAAHTGYYTETYKLVYEDGVLVSRELIKYGTSSYKAQNAKIRVGTKKKKKKKDDDEDDVTTSVPAATPTVPTTSTTPTTEAPATETPTTEAPTTEASTSETPTNEQTPTGE